MKKILFSILTLGSFSFIFAQGPQIEFECMEHDFNTVNFKSQAIYDFTFTNTGNEPLNIINVQTSCGCVGTNFERKPIMPGHTGKISVEYRNTDRPGDFKKYVTVLSNAKNSSELRLRIKGIVMENNYKIYQENGLWGCKNTEGKIVIPFEYEHLADYYEIGLLASKNNKQGIIDKNNNIIIPFEYDMIRIFKNENFMLAKKDGKWGVVSIPHTCIVPFEYDALEWTNNNHNELLAVKNGKHGIIDKHNTVIVPFEYEDLKNEYSIFIAKKNGKWGIISNDYKILSPFEYDEINYENSMIIAKKNGKWGMINKDIKTIIPFEYNILQHINALNLIYVQKNNKCGIIDTNNKIIIPIEYEDFRISLINKESFGAKKNGSWGLINNKNQTIINFIFDDIHLSSNNTFFAGKEKTTGKWGGFSIKGHRIFPSIYETPEEVLALILLDYDENFTKLSDDKIDIKLIP